jgi:hypothetical protein
MEQVADKVARNKNIIQTVSGTVASIGLEHTGKRIAGALVTPATWTLNYASDRSNPSSIDVGIYLTGFASAPASIVTGLWKAAMDDDINQKLQLVKAKEPAEFAKYIAPCDNYAWAPPQTNAMTIASNGGTAWITSAGLWVFITDARGKLVTDYTPTNFIQMYQPKQPLRSNQQGRFEWGVIRKK